MLDGDDWFEVMEEVVVIPECEPETTTETVPDTLPDTASDTYLEVNEVIVVSDSDEDDENDDEWLVARDHDWVRGDPLKPLVMDIKDDPFWSYTPSTPPTPPSPVYEPYTSDIRYKDEDEDDAEFIRRVRLG
ncbi:hypothetical protein SNE40_013535 [Patella caerulea]|uniref:Uncharacterized protein n=1 Tax=Patella caerulea TaxID=87958 RepID=A0AAN8JBS9_PATCE